MVLNLHEANHFLDESTEISLRDNSSFFLFNSSNANWTRKIIFQKLDFKFPLERQIDLEISKFSILPSFRTLNLPEFSEYWTTPIQPFIHKHCHLYY